MEIGMKLRKRRELVVKKKPRKRHTLRTIFKYKKCACGVAQYEFKGFPEIFNELRLKSQLCDGIVRCDDGTEFLVHRVILSVVSPYFKALFTNSINPNQPEVKQANVNVPGLIFHELIEYAYTGQCKITTENVEKLLKYSDQYEILGVLQLCCKYLFEQLRPDNCFGIFYIARKYYCKHLIEKGHQFIRHNFINIFNENDKFVDLPFNILVDILKDDYLNVKLEETVFEAMKAWLNHSYEERKNHLMDLLKCVRLAYVAYDSITEITSWNLIQDNNACMEYLNDSITLLNIPNIEEIDLARNYIFRPRIPYNIVFAIGGWSAGSPTNFIETYDVRADRWFLSKETDSVPRAYHGVCALRGLIYMIGGFDGNEYFNTVRCFNPQTCIWCECACMYYRRCYVSVVALDGKIYAMGGYNGRMRMSSVERYDPDRNQWELIASMQQQRSDASAASLLDKIYVVGGFNGQDVMCSAEVFDTSTNQWSYIKRMMTPRSGVSLVAHKNTLYAIGGFNGYNRLKTVEKLVLGSENGLDGWSKIAEMSTPRSNFATAILDDFIYVIGGFNDRFVSGSSTINFVEYYDTETDEWCNAASMNLNRSALSACVISGLTNAKRFTYLGCNELGPNEFKPNELDHCASQNMQ